MKRDSQIGKTQSRRSFAKTMAAALAMVPLASSLVKAQEECPTRTQLAGPGGHEVVAKTDHIPPTMVGDGSFFLELEHKLTHKSSLHGPAARPEVYTADVDSDLKQYEDIARVQVITEYEEFFTYFYYDFPKGFNAQLKIWLQDLPFSNTPIPPESNSQLLLKGNYQQAGLKTLWVEMNEDKLDAPKPIKPKARRKYKNEHKDNANKEFRVRKWWLTKSDGTPIAGFGGDAITPEIVTGYKFMISFYGDRRKTRTAKS